MFNLKGRQRVCDNIRKNKNMVSQNPKEIVFQGIQYD